MEKLKELNNFATAFKQSTKPRLAIRILGKSINKNNY